MVAAKEPVPFSPIPGRTKVVGVSPQRSGDTTGANPTGLPQGSMPLQTPPFNLSQIQDPTAVAVDGIGKMVKNVLETSSYDQKLKDYFTAQQQALSAAMAALAKVQSFKDLPEATRQDFVKQMNSNGVNITAEELENKALPTVYRSVLEAEYNLLGNVIGKKTAQNISYDEAKKDRSNHYKVLLEIVNKNHDLQDYLEGIANGTGGLTLPQTLGKLGQELFDHYKNLGADTVANFFIAFSSILLDTQHQAQLIKEMLIDNAEAGAKQLGEWLEKIITQKPANYGQTETQPEPAKEEPEKQVIPAKETPPEQLKDTPEPAALEDQPAEEQNPQDVPIVFPEEVTLDDSSAASSVK